MTSPIVDLRVGTLLEEEEEEEKEEEEEEEGSFLHGNTSFKS